MQYGQYFYVAGFLSYIIDIGFTSLLSNLVLCQKSFYIMSLKHFFLRTFIYSFFFFLHFAITPPRALCDLGRNKNTSLPAQPSLCQMTLHGFCCRQSKARNTQTTSTLLLLRWVFFLSLLSLFLSLSRSLFLSLCLSTPVTISPYLSPLNQNRLKLVRL